MTRQDWEDDALALEGLDGRTAGNVAMNQPDFLPENSPALAKILLAKVTRDALNESFAASTTIVIAAEDYLEQTAVSDE
jgi:predicted Abi (CAAX) family protease